jgi:membrane-bound lytic murein transglycosylase D
MKKLVLALIIMTFTMNSQGSSSTRELPVVMNPAVMNHLHVTLKSGHSRAKMRKMLARMNAYRPMIEAKLQAAGLPKELIVIPAVESMYQPTAVSPKEAAGLWQLVPETARHFGLRVDETTDERLDPEKATTAALKYLKSIHSRTKDWGLTLLSYNAGEGRVRKLIRQTGERDVFKLARLGHIKSDVSTNYVSKVMAALSVIGHPELVNN